MHLELASAALSDAKANTLVLFSHQSQSKTKGKEELTAQVKNLPAELKKIISEAIADKGITGKEGEHILFRQHSYAGFKNILVVGLGDLAKTTPETLRSAGAVIEQALCHAHIMSSAVGFDSAPINKNHEAFLQALAEGMLLSSYRFEELKSKQDKAKEREKIKVSICANKAKGKSYQQAFEQAVVLAESVNFSRRLGDLPGNLMNPEILAQHAVAAAKGTKIKVTVWDRARIKKEKMGGLNGVSIGSAHEPRFIIMEYKGAAASKKPVVFVGKGLTFDSGGISIKPSASMEEMKYDMCGGANVIGTILAIAKLKLKLNVTVLVPATENMPSGLATKPGDILFARNGKSMEVNNTDAEGRVILSDALCYASELKPQVIVDAATLTGAMVVALGNIHTGFFTRNQKLAQQIQKAAEASQELVWHMPLTDHHTKDMKGTFADLSNISSGKGAGSATGAAFLEQFVEKDIPWAHFDIAGTAWAVGSRLNYCPKKGASGIMIRTFVELAKQYE